MMKSDSKAIGCGILAVLGGICFIVTARLIAGHVSWGVGWIINAIGWLTIAALGMKRNLEKALTANAMCLNLVISLN